MLGITFAVKKSMEVNNKKNIYRSIKDEALSTSDLVGGLNNHLDSGYFLVEINNSDRLELGLPLEKCELEHHAKAHLFVTDSLSEHNLFKNRVIGQTLVLTQCGDGKTAIYNRSYSLVGDDYEWSVWSKVQNNVQVGKVSSLNSFTGNGVYCGTYIVGGSYEDFVLTVIDNGRTAKDNKKIRYISQFKYSLNLDGTYSYKVRTGHGNNDIIWGEWVDIGAADTTDIQDGAITAQKLSSEIRAVVNNANIAIYNNALNSQVGGNLFDKNACGILKNTIFLDRSGNLTDSETNNVTDYIAVIPGKIYACTQFPKWPFGYGIDKEFVVAIEPDIENGTILIPEGVYWVRHSYAQSWSNSFCFNMGESVMPAGQKQFGLLRTEKLSDALITTEKISDNAITIDKLDEELKGKVLFLPSVKNKAKAFCVKGNLSEGKTFSFPQNSVEIGEYITFSANVKGDFGSLYIGHGKDKGAYMKITSDTITFYSHVVSPINEKTVEHGLKIENNIQVYIEKTKTAVVDIKLISNGVTSDTFNYVYWYGNRGEPFVECEIGELTDCSFGWTCKAISSDIWAFGDSYFGVLGTNRWPAYLVTAEHTNLVINGYSGQNSKAAFTDLTNLLTIGTPKKILWCLGMNDKDSSTAANTNWLDTYNSLKTLCEQNNIELILATIPTVPTVVNKFKNKIVRSSGFRYIDFDKAVGASETTGEWFSDMLSSDGVHPSDTGALTLYNQAIADMPELLDV